MAKAAEVGIVHEIPARPERFEERTHQPEVPRRRLDDFRRGLRRPFLEAGHCLIDRQRPREQADLR